MVYWVFLLAQTIIFQCTVIASARKLSKFLSVTSEASLHTSDDDLCREETTGWHGGLEPPQNLKWGGLSPPPILN